MEAKLSDRGQMVIPLEARKKARLSGGDVFSVEIEGEGRILLVRLERPKSRARQPKLFSLTPWDARELARAYRNKQVDADYSGDASIRGQAFPQD